MCLKPVLLKTPVLPNCFVFAIVEKTENFYSTHLLVATCKQTALKNHTRLKPKPKLKLKLELEPEPELEQEH
jgi:hypothetical protein